MSDLKELLTFYEEIGADFMERSQTQSVPGTGTGGGSTSTLKSAGSLEEIILEIKQCTNCNLHKSKKNYVPGEGCLNPDVMFIGEGPGETEDNFGRPFIGNAGQLLDKIIQKMGYSRETVYIANIVKCRPPHNRDPEPAEVEACRPYLLRQVQTIKPKVIVCLGKVALNNLMQDQFSIMKNRGRLFDFQGVPMIPTYHPAFILHQKTRREISKAKWDMWRDMEKVLEIIKKT